MLLTLLLVVTGLFNSFLKPPQLPTACTTNCATKLNKSQNHLCPHSNLFTHGWREAIKCVLQRDTSVTTGSRTHALLDRNTRARVWCCYPLDHNTPITVQLYSNNFIHSLIKLKVYMMVYSFVFKNKYLWF